MAAFTFNTKYFKLSLTSDAITLYPTFEYYETPGLRNCLDVVMGACNKLDFVIKTLPDKKPTENNVKFIESMKTVLSDKQDFDRIVIRINDDHSLYHNNDGYNLDESHWHIKFKNIMTMEQILKVFKIFIEAGLIIEQEKVDFFKALEKRYEACRLMLNTMITKNAVHDSSQIIKTCLQDCTDNDMLAYMHRYLLSPQFDYLRDETIDTSNIRWQGTDSHGQVVPTTKSWAMIEKFIAYQMAQNIHHLVSRFTPQIGAERTKQLSVAYPFFAIKRKATAKTNASNIVAAFSQGNGAVLDAKQDKLRHPFKHHELFPDTASAAPMPAATTPLNMNGAVKVGGDKP